MTLDQQSFLGKFTGVGYTCYQLEKEIQSKSLLQDILVEDCSATESVAGEDQQVTGRLQLRIIASLSRCMHKIFMDNRSLVPECCYDAFVSGNNYKY